MNITFIGGIGLVIYRILLDLVYFNIISPIYAYSGFIDNRTAYAGVVSWMLLASSFFLIKDLLFTNQEGVSHIIISLLYLLSFVPFTSCVYSGIAQGSFIVCNSIYWLILIVCAKYIVRKPQNPLSPIKVGYIIINDQFVMCIGLLSLFVVVFVSGRYTHFRLNFDLFSVYNLRLAAREYRLGTLLSYAFAWTKAINTVLFAYCLINRRYIYAILFFGIQMLSFGVDGSKSTFFLPFVVLFSFFFCKKMSMCGLKLFFLYGAIGGTLVALVEYYVKHTYILSTLFIRRVLFVPSLLNVNYYDFFTKHEPDYFRGSFLRHFGFNSPYSADAGISRMIGRIYYNSPTMNCNSGLISDAISNLGYAGVAFMPIFIVMFLYLLDRSAKGLDRRLLLVSAVYSSLAIIGTTFTTVLLTHGLLIIIFVVWMMQPKCCENNIKEVQGYS